MSKEEIVEGWADVIGYEGFYKVSNHGRVKALAKTVGSRFNSKRTRPEKMLSVIKNSNGYGVVNLYDGNKKMKIWLVHRLLAEVFMPNHNNYDQINHKDGNKMNNHIKNLEWCNRSQNMIHAFKTGLQVAIPASEHWASKKVVQKDLSGNILNSWDSIREAAKDTGYSRQHISQSCKKQFKRKRRAFIWELKK